MFLDGLFGVQVVVTGPLTFLNWVFAFAFPLLPYELFTFMPWAMLYLKNSKKVTVNALVGFITLFPAAFFGCVHALGSIQFITVWFGQPGICGAHHWVHCGGFPVDECVASMDL